MHPPTLLQRPEPAGYHAPVESAAPSVDEAIVAGFMAGDEDSLRLLYDATSRLVFGFCRRSLGNDAAADVTQEVYVAAWRSRERYRPERGTLTGWLMGIARFKMIDALRARGRQPVTDTSDAHPEAGQDETRIDDMAQRMVVGAALAELPERARSMVEMAFWQDMTHTEISETTGVPLGTVKSDIRRGLERLRRQLEGFDASGS